MFVLIFLLPMTFALPASIYNNSRFEPNDSFFIVNDLYPMTSLMNCVCACNSEAMCLTALYNGINQTCKLFFARLDQGTLSIVVTNRRNAVINLKNKTLPTPSRLTGANENPFGIWNTSASSDSTPAASGSLVGNLIDGDNVTNLFDGNFSTKYSNRGSCTILSGLTSTECGSGSGIFVTLQRGASLLVAFRIGTSSSSASYDPLTTTVEGSNQSASSLSQGSSWTLIYNGTTGLDVDPGRQTSGPTISLSNNSKSFFTYRILITSKRGNGNLVQYSELELLGY